MTTDLTDLIEQFADGEAVAPEALMAALATTEGREYLRGILELRALMSETHAMAGGLSPARGLSPSRGLSPGDRPLPLRIAAAALIAVTAAAAGYLAGNRRAESRPVIDAAQHLDQTAPPAPTTVIKLDATHGWRDQSGGF